MKMRHFSRKVTRMAFFAMMILLILFPMYGCSKSEDKDKNSNDDPASSTDTDSDTDTDADSDTDTDADSDSDSDSDTDKDPDKDKDSDTNKDPDPDKDPDTDKDPDIDAEVDCSELAGTYELVRSNGESPEGKWDSKQLEQMVALVPIYFYTWEGSMVITADGQVTAKYSYKTNIPFEIDEEMLEMMGNMKGRFIALDDSSAEITSEYCETETGSLEYTLDGDELSLTYQADFCQTEPEYESGSVTYYYRRTSEDT